MKPVGRLGVLLGVLVLSGCASLEVDRNLSDTSTFAKSNYGNELRRLDSDDARRQAQTETDTLLEQTLTQANAERLALAYSPAFQILLAENAAASARVTQSARLPNPVFSFEKLVRNEEGARDLDIGRTLAFSVLDLLFLPSRIAIAKSAQERLRLQSAGDVVQAISETRQAWVNAVAAQQSVAYFERVYEAADAGAELARRMQAAGNFSRLQRAHEHEFYAEAAAQLKRARQRNVETREALVRTLGLTPLQAQKLKLPDRLPDLPKALKDEQPILQQGLDERLDVRMARFELDTVARNRGLTRVQSVVDGLHVGLVSNSESGKPTQRGYEVEFPIPIFDFGGARRTQAEAEYMAAVHRAQQTAVSAASQLRQQYSAYRTAYELARHYRDEIVPLRKTISDERMLKYNGMLIGVFELLADAREQVASVLAATESERDFWLADAQLQAAVLGRPLNASSSREPAVAGVAGGDGGH